MHLNEHKQGSKCAWHGARRTDGTAPRVGEREASEGRDGIISAAAVGLALAPHVRGHGMAPI